MITMLNGITKGKLKLVVVLMVPLGRARLSLSTACIRNGTLVRLKREIGSLKYLELLSRKVSGQFVWSLC